MWRIVLILGLGLGMGCKKRAASTQVSVPSEAKSNSGESEVQQHFEIQVESPFYLVDDMGDYENVVHIDASYFEQSVADDTESTEAAMVNSILVSEYFGDSDQPSIEQEGAEELNLTGLLSYFRSNTPVPARSIDDGIPVYEKPPLSVPKKADDWGKRLSERTDSSGSQSFSRSSDSELFLPVALITDAVQTRPKISGVIRGGVQYVRYRASLGDLEMRAYFRDKWEKAQQKFQKEGNDYFFNRIGKKWLQAFEKTKEIGVNGQLRNYGSDRMSEIKYEKGAIPGIDNPTVHLPNAKNAFLGVLPNKGALDAFVAQSKGTGIKSADIIGLISETEARFARGEVQTLKGKEFSVENLLREDPILRDSVKGPADAAAFKALVDNGDIKMTWKRFQAEDRLHVSAESLLGSSLAIKESLKAGNGVLVHCKSGQGRSAAAMALGRVLYVLDDLKLKSSDLTSAQKTAAVNYIIKQEMAQVKASRPEVDISPPKRVEIYQLAYEYSGILNSKTTAAQADDLLEAVLKLGS